MGVTCLNTFSMLTVLAFVASAFCLIEGTPVAIEVEVTDEDIANSTVLFNPADVIPLKRDLEVTLEDEPLAAALENNTILFDPEDLIPLKRSLDRRTSDCDCGRSPVLDRIVAGQEVNPKHSLPYQAYLQACQGRRCAMCGATLINKKYAITAMHCLPDGFDNLQLVLGEHNIKQAAEQHAKTIGVTAIRRSDYDERTTTNDIAILKLSEEVVFNDHIQPACLPSNTEEKYVGQSAVVSGWGTTSSGGDTSNVLKKTDQTILADSDRDCIRGSGENNLHSGKMCAYKQGTDSCQGDSGGPLVVQEDGRSTLVGVVSYGIGCASPGYAGVYARVTNYLDWINDNVADGWCGTSTGSSGSNSATTTTTTTTTTTVAPTSNNGECDFTCTNVGYLTAPYVNLNGILAACNQGMCYAKDGRDLCQVFRNPCGSSQSNSGSQNTVQCAKPCYLPAYLQQYQNRGQNVVNVSIGLFRKYPAKCDLTTNNCCATDGGDLCARLGFLANLWG